MKKLRANVITFENAIQHPEPIHLLATGSWPESYHRLDRTAAYAIIAAVSSGKPLLVRGEAGVGKSQLARVAAKLLDREFISKVVQPNDDYEDLLWSFDHILRLADAQMANTNRDTSRVKNAENYVAPGPLWYAYNWEQAANNKCNNHFHTPEGIELKDVKEKGLVLLIDEIDKADISLTNGLLEVLGNGSFSVPPLGITVGRNGQSSAPLIVLTSNDVRQLPEALVRRCVVHKIKLPEPRDELITYLVEIGRTHYDAIDIDVLSECAQQIVADRELCTSKQKTGQAEYLDLLKALTEISKDDKTIQLKWLDKLSACFKKSGND